MSVLRFIRCAVGAESYCIDLSMVHSIQRSDLLQRSIGPDGSIGWLAGRQEKIPVFSLQSQLEGISISKRETGAILVLNTKPKQWAIMVDRLLGMIEPAKDEIHPLPEITDNRTYKFFKGVIRIEQGLSLYLDPERLHPDVVLNSRKENKGSSPLSGTNGHKGQKAESNGRQGKGQILLFSVGTTLSDTDTLISGLSITQVVEILELPSITPVPALPRYISGLVNWRNRPVPIIDLSIRLGLGSSASSFNERLLVARVSNNTELIGFPIRPNTKIKNLPLDHFPSKCEVSLDESLMRGFFKLKKEFLAIPDISKVYL